MNLIFTKIFSHRYSAIILIAVLVFVGGIFIFQKNNNSLDKDNAENQELIAKVDRIMVLPTDEAPTIATVSDLSPLKGQAFFADAKVGDKVLIYSKAKKAILYDPVLKKIVNIAPFVTSAKETTKKP